MNLHLLDGALLLYAVSFSLYLVSVLAHRASLSRGGALFLGLGFAVQLAGMVVRWWESHRLGYGYIPLSNMYESLVFFSWSVVLLYFFLKGRYRYGAFGLVASGLSTLLLLLPFLVPMSRRIKPLVPALRSNWLAIHVITCFFAYAAFAFAFALSLAYLCQRSWEKGGEASNWLPSSGVLEDATYRLVLIGFAFLTLGIITGAAWAHYAWGSYWSWDPKETWSLITWFIYASWLHAHIMRGWRGKRTAILSIVGFAAVIFTYFGVNYLLSGLHSYV